MTEEINSGTETTVKDSPTETNESDLDGSSRRQYLRRAGFIIGSSTVIGRASANDDESTIPAKNEGNGSTTSSRNEGNDFYNSNRAPLQKTPFVQLPLGSVKAKGWLQDQLERQKDGLTGSADTLYDAISDNSGWLGGDDGGWERAPYYVKGLIPLAYILDDEELISTAEKWVNGVLQTQRESGDFGPTNDWWPRMIVLYYLRDYYQATGDERIIPFLMEYFHYQQNTLPEKPLTSWARARGADNIDVVLWLYNITEETFLLNLAETLQEQTLPWSQIYSENLFYESERFYPSGGSFHPHHIVNVAQGLKFPSVVYQFTGDKQDRTAMQKGIDHLMNQYGRIDGQFSGSEMLSDKTSTSAVELCADVERMLSQAEGIRILGDARLGDQLEKVAYNSLPGHTSPSLGQISYYQIPNQVEREFEHHGYTQDYKDGLMPSPHSGYPCCCYNWHMGWPKFVQNLWAATHDNGVAVIAYGPSEVTAKVGDGQEVTITEETDYPFREKIHFTVSISDRYRLAKFPIRLRIPHWTENARIERNPGKSENASEHAQNERGHTVYNLEPGSFHTLEGPWKDGDTFTLKLPMKLRTSQWINDSIGIERGPLAFGLKIEETWNKHHDFYQNFDSYEVRPNSPWNYALQLDSDNPSQYLEVKETAFDGPPFSLAHAPLSITAKGKQIPNWKMKSVGEGTVTLGKADGQWHEINNTSKSLLAEEAHHLRVVAEGPKIAVYVDNSNKPVLEVEDDTYSTGTVGVRSYNSQASFTNVDLHSLDGSNIPISDFSDWQYFGGNWNYSQGNLEVDAEGGNKAVTSNLNVSDFVLEADVTADQNGNAGLIFRVQDPTDETDGYKGYYVGLDTVSSEKSIAEEPPQEFITADGSTEDLTLIPYGAGNLRVSYFPHTEFEKDD